MNGKLIADISTIKADMIKIIKEEVGDRNYSDIARECGLTSNEISYIVRDIRTPKLETIIKVLVGLGYEVNIDVNKI